MKVLAATRSSASSPRSGGSSCLRASRSCSPTTWGSIRRRRKSARGPAVARGQCPTQGRVLRPTDGSAYLRGRLRPRGALPRRPGVRSRRWAGATGTDPEMDAANNAELFRRLAGAAESRRGARYRCVLVYLPTVGAVPRVFEGVSAGRILETPRGKGGFGYDPFFFSDELGLTFGEASPEDRRTASVIGAGRCASSRTRSTRRHRQRLTRESRSYRGEGRLGSASRHVDRFRRVAGCAACAGSSPSSGRS